MRGDGIVLITIVRLSRKRVQTRRRRRFMPAMHGHDAASLVPHRAPAFRYWALAFRVGAGHRRANGGDTGALFPSFASNTHARRLLRRPLELGCPARAVKRREGHLRRLVRRYEAVRLRSCLPHRSPALHVSSTKPDSPAFPAADPVLVGFNTLQHWLWQRLQVPTCAPIHG